jgi:hypothetical protein
VNELGLERKQFVFQIPERRWINFKTLSNQRNGNPRVTQSPTERALTCQQKNVWLETISGQMLSEQTKLFLRSTAIHSGYH